MFDKDIYYTYNYNDCINENFMILAEKGCGFMESGPSKHCELESKKDSYLHLSFSV